MFMVGYRPMVDIRKLKSEIKKLTELNRFHKKRKLELRPKLGNLDYHNDIHYDRESKEWKHKNPALDVIYKEWSESLRECGKLSPRITKLYALRALIRGKNHFGPNSKYLPQFDEDYLWKWVYPEAKEFALSGI